MLYRSVIRRACVCPCLDFGMYNMSIEMASLGCFGIVDLSLPTGIILYSAFLLMEQVKHDLQILLFALLLCGW